MPKSDYKNLADDPKYGKKAYEFVMDLHTSLKRKRRSFENIWAECNDAYRTIERRSYFSSSFHYCSNDLRDSMLTIIPKYAKAIWYQDIPFDLIPIGEEGEDDDLEEVNTKVLEWDFRNLRIYLKYVDSLFQKGIFGTTIVKTPPHFQDITKNLRLWSEQKIAGQKSLPGKKKLERKKEKDRTFMGTDFVVTDMFNFWIDPTTIANGTLDAVEYSDCVEALCLQLTDLDRGKESGIYKNVRKIEDYYIGAKRSRDQSVKQRVKRAGHIDSETSSGVSKARQEGANRSYEVMECYADYNFRGDGIERCLITVGAEKETIRLQGWEGEKPYLSSRHIPNGYNKEFYGTGIIENQLSNHYERNATRKQIVSARTMGLNLELFSDQSGLVNKSDRLRTAPNKVHFVKNINGVKPFEKPIGQILQSAIAHETNLKSETQQSTGNTPYIQGSDASKINDTATGILRLQEAGLEKFSLPLQVDEAELLEPFVRRCLQNNIDYRKESFVIRLTDKTPRKVYPDELSANFDVYAKGSSELQNRERRQIGLLKAWELGIQAAELEAAIYGQPLTNFEKLKKEIFANIGISQPDQFVIDIESLQGGNQTQVLTADMEWILLQRMRDGVAPIFPILIQPGEDYRDHYEKHKAKTTEEEFLNMPEELKVIWYTHLKSYEGVLKKLDEKKKEKRAQEDIQSKEVEVSKNG
jgi:hypothetical protein